MLTAIDLHEKHQLLDNQYARAKNRYAQMLAEQGKQAEASQIFSELEEYWSCKQDGLNPYFARFCVAHADYMVDMQSENLVLIEEKYKKAYEILCVTEGEKSSFTMDVHKKLSAIRERLKINLPVKNSWKKSLYYGAAGALALTSLGFCLYGSWKMLNNGTSKSDPTHQPIRPKL